MKVFWDLTEDDLIKQHYLDQNGIETLIKLLPNRNYNGIKARANLLNLKRKIVYTKDENFFSIPNVINCAISGLIATDGCIGDPRKKSGYRLSIGLNIKDISILESIKSYTNYNGKFLFQTVNTTIKNYRKPTSPEYHYTSKMVTLAFYNAKRWCDDLDKNWNITPRKTLNLKAPNITETEHVLAYFSGAVCGDGTIYLQNINNRLTIDLLGTFEFLSFFKNKFDILIPYPIDSQVRQERRGSNIFTYRISGSKAFILAKMVLCLNIPRLDRKWDIARNYINLIENSSGLHSKFIFNLKSGLSENVIAFLKQYNQPIIIPPVAPTSIKVLKALEFARSKNPYCNKSLLVI